MSKTEVANKVVAKCIREEIALKPGPLEDLLQDLTHAAPGGPMMIKVNDELTPKAVAIHFDRYYGLMEAPEHQVLYHFVVTIQSDEGKTSGIGAEPVSEKYAQALNEVLVELHHGLQLTVPKALTRENLEMSDFLDDELLAKGEWGHPTDKMDKAEFAIRAGFHVGDMFVTIFFGRRLPLGVEIIPEPRTLH